MNPEDLRRLMQQVTRPRGGLLGALSQIRRELDQVIERQRQAEEQARFVRDVRRLFGEDA